MEYRTLGATDLKVSAICLGTMTFGQQNTEADAHAQLDMALARGVNFIDTAEMYPSPPSAEAFGRTETQIGTWLARNKSKRDTLILATKVTGACNNLAHVRDGTGRLDRKTIFEALDASLKRLQTDYVDLYQVHSPSRYVPCFGRLDYEHRPERDGVPIAETLDALGELVQQGKVRHIGVSNETPWGVMEYLRHQGGGRPRIQTIQNAYSLMNRVFEIGLSEVCLRERVGLLTYSSLAMGTLSGKYLNGARPPGARMTLFGRFDRYTRPRAEAAAATYVTLARKAGIDPAQMALAFALARPFVASVIIGATTLQQLDSNLGAAAVKLPAALIKEIDDIHALNANPCP
jgi:aryl-alcohol dehydrogenase-like predicted oxidoreductase